MLEAIITICIRRPPTLLRDSEEAWIFTVADVICYSRIRLLCAILSGRLSVTSWQMANCCQIQRAHGTGSAANCYYADLPSTKFQALDRSA